MIHFHILKKFINRSYRKKRSLRKMEASQRVAGIVRKNDAKSRLSFPSEGEPSASLVGAYTELFTRKKRTTRKKSNKKGGNNNLEIMNCHPSITKNSIKKDSCFTPEIIKKIRDSYNEKHSQTKISTDDPKKIWNELNKRLYHCKREDCWLKELKDPTMKKNIEKFIFAPTYPKEWDTNPNEWLSNFDIIAVLKQYEKTYPDFKFIGPAMIDFDKKVKEYNYQCVEQELCTFSLENILKQGKNKIGIIFNLSPHDKRGSHWVSLFIDVPAGFIYYFDSVGNDIPLEIKLFVDRVILQANEKKKELKYEDSHKMKHQTGDSECGVYSLFFIITMLTSSVESGKQMSVEKKMNFFRKERITDKYIENYRKIYFNPP